MTLDEANALSRTEFVARFGSVYEHSPWVAERAWDAWPFTSVDALAAAMAAAVKAASPDEKMKLLCAHPELASKASLAGEVADASRQEQDSAGLRQCSPEELETLRWMNAAYRQNFGFPFIVAVRGLDRAAILARLQHRLTTKDRAVEFAEALRQVNRIAALRLEALLAPGDRT